MKIDPKSALDFSQTTVNFAKDNPRLDAKLGMDEAEIRKVAQDFESLFLEIVLKSMRGTVSKSGLVDGGNGEEIFRSMLDGEYAKSMASQGTSGLADSIANQMMNLVNQQADKITVRAGQEAYRPK